MSKFLTACAVLFLLTGAPAALAKPAATAAPATAGIDGAWDVTATYAGGGSGAGALTLIVTGEAVGGASQPLDENQFFPLTLKGRRTVGGADLSVWSAGRLVGNVVVGRDGQRLSGTGLLYGVKVTLSGSRPDSPRRAPATFTYRPESYQLQFSSRAAPVLILAPGDRVKTTTLDNEGQDAAMAWRGMPGNTLTGPFLIEGAMPGDTLVIHLEKVELNRDSAKMFSGVISSAAVEEGYAQTPAKGWGRAWVLDRKAGVARLAAPGERLAGLEVPLRPMIGSIGVAPPLNQAIYAGELGFHGGNLDYNRLVAGATLYLPVFRAGAYLALGDGHAAQGDGEISGQGLETSLDVEFTVDLIKGRSLGQVWLEDAEDVMVCGIANDLEAAMRMATTGMARWLKDRYGLNDSEVAALMSSSVRYDIAEVVDGRQNVVARISKKTLAGVKAPS